MTEPAAGGLGPPPCGVKKAEVEKADLSALRNPGVAIAEKSSLGAKAHS